MRLSIFLFVSILLTACASGGSGISKLDLIAAANSGDAERQYQLAGKYYIGEKGLYKRDFKKAHDWYLKSAKQNNYKAQSMLGLLYKLGLGVEKDEKQAENWYLKSIKNGDTLSIANLGMLYLDQKKHKKAHTWLNKSLSLNDEFSIKSRKGVFYYLSVFEADKKNYTEAYKWYGLALVSGGIYEKRDKDLKYLKRFEKISTKLSKKQKLKISEEIIDIYYDKFVRHQSFLRNNNIKTYKNISILEGHQNVRFIGYLSSYHRKSFGSKAYFEKKNDKNSRLNYAYHSYNIAGHYLDYGNVSVNYGLAKTNLEDADNVFANHYDKKALGFMNKIVKAKLKVISDLDKIQKQRLEEYRSKKTG